MEVPTVQPEMLTGPDGLRYRDLNHNGVLDPFEDPRRPVAERVEDLLGRLSLEEKVGLMFHTVIEAGPDGSVLPGPGHIAKSGTREVVIGKLVNHFNVHVLDDARGAARWMNAVQAVAQEAPHGIPVTISTDPRHGFIHNSGASFTAGPFSQWPEPLGIAALRDPEAMRTFGDIARQEYVAVGIRAALHPTVDLGTEPRWARLIGTLGQDPELTAELGLAYVLGFQGDDLGPGSVACTAKHFPGGGSQLDGEDSHFPYGREQVYPGGRGEDHLLPFEPLIDAGVAAMMPYYSMPIGLSLRGIDIPEVGFGYSREVVTELLRDRLGYDGVVLSDWELVNDNHVGDQVLPARAWGVESLSPHDRMLRILDAGADQFGGEECVDLLLDLVRDGEVSEERIDASARRLLTVKYHLGLFDNPFVDEDLAEQTLGREEFRRAGHEAQARSVTILALEEGAPLPLASGVRVYSEGINQEAIAAVGVAVERPEDADVALLRIAAPFEPRNDLFLEAAFHAGSLDFPPGLPVRLRRIAEHCPLILDVSLDRAAVLTPLLGIPSVLTATYGASDAAWLDALTGAIPPAGRLPIALPRSMEQVRRHEPDVPGFDDPLFDFGHGLDLPAAIPEG